MGKSAFIVAITATFGASVAYAQSQEPFELNTILLETTGDNAVDVNAEDLERQNPNDIQDLYKSEPTIAVGSSIPASQKLYVNGVEETNLAVSIDGSRQNNKIFHHSTTTLIDPSLLKAVRIEPGVASADSGPAAMGGSVVYETKDVDDLLAEGDDFGGTAKVEYETQGSTVSTSGSVFGRVNNMDYLGYLKVAKGDPVSDGANTDVIGSGTNLQSGLFKLGYETDQAGRFELSYERVNDDEDRPYRGNIGQIIGGRPVPLTRPYAIDRQNLVFTYTGATADGWWDPKVQIAYSTTDLTINEDTSRSYGETKSLNGKIENRFALSNGEINAGVDFYSDNAVLDYESYASTTYNGATTEKLKNYGAFVQARIEPTQRARLSYGLRADYQKFTGIDGTTSSGSGVSGNMSGEYDITDTVTISAGHSRVWGGTSLAENFVHNADWTYPAAGFQDATSQNTYLGLSADFDRWNVSGKVFQTKLNNIRTASYSGGSDLSSDMDSKGYELGLGYYWNNAFARVGYAHIDTTVNGNAADSYSGNYLTTPIGEVVTLEVGHTFDQRNLTVGADAQIVLENKDTYNPDTGAAGPTLPSYEVLNAFVSWNPKAYSNLTVRGEIKNILDTTYASRATYGQEFGSVVPLNEPGRSLKVSASLKF